MIRPVLFLILMLFEAVLVGGLILFILLPRALFELVPFVKEEATLILLEFHVVHGAVADGAAHGA